LKERKAFFFEKKNQKTFLNWAPGSFTNPVYFGRRFFASPGGAPFSKKEALSFSL
jgi:hypothetical protein